MSSRERLALDLTIFAAVIAAANPATTGVFWHERLGFALVVPALAHLVANWDWVVKTLANLVSKARAASLVNLTVDLALFASLVSVTLSGVLVIPGLAAALGLNASPLWHVVHLTSSNLTIALALAHFALHWKWVASVTRRMALPSRPDYRSVAGGPPMAPTPRPVRQYVSAHAERH